MFLLRSRRLKRERQGMSVLLAAHWLLVTACCGLRNVTCSNRMRALQHPRLLS